MPMNTWLTTLSLKDRRSRHPFRQIPHPCARAPTPRLRRTPAAAIAVLVLAPILSAGCTQETDPLAPYDRSEVEPGGTAGSVQPRTDALQDDLTPLEADIAGIDRDLAEIRQARAGDARQSYDRLLDMRDDIDRAELLLDYLRAEVNAEIRVQSAYLGASEAAAAPLLTSSAARPPEPVPAEGTVSPAPAAASSALPPRTAPGGGRSPLVVIRFDEGSPDYEPALHQAVTAAVDRKPDVIFDVVAISPRAGTPAQQAQAADEARSHGRDVFRTLMTMGLPGEQVTFDHAALEAAASSEVRVFVR